MRMISGLVALSAGALVAACASLPELAPVDVAYADPVTIDEAYPPSIVELNFESYGKRLNGIAYLADGPGPHPTVILLHGYPGNEKNLDIAQAVRRDGFNVFFFHYRGAWGSEGEFSFTHVIEDVASAADYLRANAVEYRTDPDKLILIGHSMGGFAALEAAARDENIQCVAGLAAANFGAIADMLDANAEAAAGFSAYSDGMQMLAGWDGEKAISEILDNREAFDVSLLAPQLAGKSVLLVAGDKDASVPPDQIHVQLVEAYEMQPGLDLEAVILSGDHSFSWSRIALTETVLEWIDDCR